MNHTDKIAWYNDVVRRCGLSIADALKRDNLGSAFESMRSLVQLLTSAPDITPPTVEQLQEWYGLYLVSFITGPAERHQVATLAARHQIEAETFGALVALIRQRTPPAGMPKIERVL